MTEELLNKYLGSYCIYKISRICLQHNAREVAQLVLKLNVLINVKGTYSRAQRPMLPNDCQSSNSDIKVDEESALK